MAEQSRRKTGKARKIILGLVAAVVVLVLVVVLGGPAIAGALAPGMIESAASKQINGDVRVAGVSLSWTGKQRIEGLRILDPATGDAVVTVSGTLDRGLLGLASNPSNLGTLRVDTLKIDARETAKGEIDLVRAVEPTAPSAPRPAKPARPMQVPRGLALRIEGQGLEASYTMTDEHGKPVTIEIRNVSIDGGIAGSDVRVAISGEGSDGNKVLDLRAEALGLIAPDGTVDPSKAAISLDAFADAPANAPIDAGAELHLTGSGGRIRAVPGTRTTIEGVIPASLLSQQNPDGTSFRAQTSMPALIEVRQLDVPLPTAAGLNGVDWRNAAVEIGLATGTVAGEVVGPDGTRQVQLDPITGTLYSASPQFDLGLILETSAQVDGVATGTLTLDAKAVGVVDQAGALRLPAAGTPAGPDWIRARLTAQAIPTSLVQPFIDTTGVSLRDALGETVALDVRAGQLSAQAASRAVELDEMLGQEGASKELAGRPYLAGTMESSMTTARFDFFLDNALVQTRNNGVRIETDALGAFAQPFIPASDDFSVEGAGTGIVEIKGLRMPIGGDIDLRAAAGVFRVIVGGMDARVKGAVVGVSSTDVEVTLAPNTPPAWKLDARGVYEGAQFAALGAGTVPGLLAPSGVTDAPLGLTPGAARPQGEITLIDLPTGLANIAAPSVADLASATFGPTIRGAITSTPTGGDSIDVGIRLEGATAAIDGHAEVAPNAVRIGAEGITAAVTRAGAVLGALSGEGADGGGPVSFGDGGRITATIRDIAVPLDGSCDVNALSANLDVALSDITGSARRGDGAAVPFSIVQGEIRGGIRPGGAYDGVLTMTGTAAGKDTRVNGAAKGVLPAGGDPTAIVRAIETASLEARSVPTALLGIIDEKTAAMAMEAAGDTADITVTPSATSAKAWDLALVGSSGTLEVRSAVAVDRDAVAVGPTSGRALVTPALFDAAAGDAIASMDPRPRLGQPVPLDLEAQRFRIAQTDAGWGLATGESLAARVRASGDLVARNIAKLGEGQPASVGVSGLEATVSIDASGRGGASARGIVFEPDTGARVASVVGNVQLPADPPVGEVHISEGDVAALDRMLGMDGMLVEALGEQIGVDAQMQGAGGAITADVRSPRLTASGALTRAEDGSMRLTKPATARWNATARAVDRFVLGQKPGEEAKVSAQDGMTIDLTVDRLALGPAESLFRPGTFELATQVRTTGTSLLSPSGVAAPVPALAGTIRSDAATQGIAFNVADASAGESSLRVVGDVKNVWDPQGDLSVKTAALTVDADGRLATALVDALAGTGGKATALLGDMITIDANATNFGQQAVGGLIDLKASSENALATISGKVIAPEVLLVRDGSEVRVTRITGAASDEIFGVIMPFLTSFEKSEKDQPATIVLNRLEAPLDGNMANLNGEVIADLGTMRFQTKTFLGKLLKVFKQKDAGSVGERIEPVTFLINSGIATYEKMVIPAGEFTMESYGTLDLVKKKMDIYVLVPVYALAEEVASVVSQVPGLDRLTSVPISVKGPFDNPSTKVDLEEMIKRAPSNIGKGVEGLIGGTLGNLLGGDKDEDKSAEPKKELTPEEKAAKQQRKKEKEEEEKRQKEEKKQKKKDGSGG